MALSDAESVTTVNPRLRIALLGHAHFTLDGAPFKFRALPKSLDLLAHLLLERSRPLSRETLAFTHWPDDSEAVAGGKMRRHLHDLQKALPEPVDGVEWLIIDRDMVQWNTDASAWLDVEAFERLGASEETRAEALALYSGDLLEQVYDDWIFPTRERLRSLHLRYLASMVRTLGARRDYGAAIDYGEKLLSHEPWREDILREVIALRYQSGDRAGALKAYATFVTRLREEMNVAVMPETIALHGTILANGRISSQPTRGAAAPVEVAARDLTLPLAGRQLQVDQLRAAWQRAARGNGNAVFLCGEAGIGKSRLVDELCGFARMQGARVLLGFATDPERAPYAPLNDALESGAPYLKPETLAALRAGGSAESLAQRARLFERYFAALRECASSRPVVLVLEDLHQAGGATVELLDYFVRGLSQTPILLLATFREEELALNPAVRGVRRALLESGRATEIALDRLDRAATLEIVQQLLDETTDATLAERVFAQTGGHPLYLAELLREPDAIRTTPEADGTLASLIVDRRAMLNESAATLAEIAAVAGERFDTELLAEASGWRNAQIIAGTRQLLDQHLIAESTGSGSIAYAFTHAFIRDVVYREIPEARRSQRHGVIASALARRSDATAAPAVVAHHFERAHLDEDAANWYGRAASLARAVFALDDTVRFAQASLQLAAIPSVRLEMLRVLEDVYGVRGERDLQLRTIEAMEIEATCEEGSDRLDAIARRIRLDRVLGQREREAAGIASLAERYEAATAEWRARVHLERGLNAKVRGRFADSIEELDAAAALYEQTDEHAHHLETLCALAEVRTIERDIAGAARALDDARHLAERSDNQQAVAAALQSSIAALMWRQEFREARELAERFLTVCRTIGDRAGEATAHERLAAIASRSYDWPNARTHYEAALTYFRAQRAPHGMAVTLLNFGIHLTRTSQFDAARRAIDESLVWFRQLQDARGEFLALLNSGMVGYFSGRFEEAHGSTGAALVLARRLKSPTFEAMSLSNLGGIERELGQLDVAIAHMREMKALFDTALRPLDHLQDLADLALAYAYKGAHLMAKETADELLALRESCSDAPPNPQFVSWAVACAYLPSDAEKARVYLGDAYRDYGTQRDAHPDDASRANFAEIFFNRAIVAAWEGNEWPEPIGRLADAQSLH